MKSLHRALIPAVLLLSALLPPRVIGAAPNSIAFFAKIIPQVDHKTSASDWVEAERGGTVSYGDIIRSGEKAFAIIKFSDGSMVKVREKSELHVKEEAEGETFLKNMNLQKGVIGFIIGSQRENEEFRFTSPTSVAAIRGTKGSFTSSSKDTLIVTEGLVSFRNVISDQSGDVAAGFTGIASPDGSLTIRPSTPEERAAARAVINEGETDNLFELELQDGEGNKRKLKIEFRD